MQIAERVFSHQRAAIQPHPANHFGCPDGIAGEQRVEFRRTQETHHADLHNEVVDQLLGLLFIEDPGVEVALDIDIEERGGAPQRHRAAVLRFHRRQIGEVQPLYRFLGVARRAGDITAIFRRHLLHLQQRAAVLRQLFTQTNSGFQILPALERCLQIGEL